MYKSFLAIASTFVATMAATQTVEVHRHDAPRGPQMAHWEFYEKRYEFRSKFCCFEEEAAFIKCSYRKGAIEFTVIY